MRVVILGAGASKSYDESLTKVRMPIATDFFKTFNQLPISEHPWVLVGNFLKYLHEFHNVAPNEFHKYNVDIEKIHSEIEDKLLEVLKSNDTDSLGIPDNNKYLSAYIQLMFIFSNVINEIQNGPVSTTHLKLAKKLNNDDVVVTFNWDTLMDRALESATDWNCFDGYRVKPIAVYDDEWVAYNKLSGSPFPTLLKLHGSTNWLTGYPKAKQGKIVLNQEIPAYNFFVYRSNIKPYSTYDGRYMDGYTDFSYGYYPPNLPLKGEAVPEGFVAMRIRLTSEDMPARTSDSHGIDSIPLIIPPVKHKDYSLYGDLFSVLWSNAEDAIASADEIVIIGYSFPETDIQSDVLFRKALVRRTSFPQIILVNPEPDRIKERFAYSYGFPLSHITVIPEYFDSHFDLSRIM